MDDLRRWVRPVFEIFLALGTVALSSLALFLLRPVLSTAVVALLYLIPVVICAALWGRLAGITASILSFFTYNFLFIAPYYTLRVGHVQDFLAIIVFLSVAVLISSLMARAQANLASVQAREREATQLYRLSLDLAGKHNPALIAETLAQQLDEFFLPWLLEVALTKTAGGTCVRLPADASPAGEEPPSQLLELSSPRGALGEIRIWTQGREFPPEEKRLLQMFANQGALALDRAILANSETRARVLEESDRLKTAILSSVSHELRTPLATIQASASSLFNPQVNLEPDARAELESLVLEETDHMAQLVGNLLNMSRIEAGALKLQRQWNSLTESVDACVGRILRTKSGQQIRVDLPDDLPLVAVDAALMEQVINNLIGNSLKFAPRGTVITICARVEEPVLRVSIRNQGPPIPEEHIGHIFEKFYPVPGMDQQRGTGLGLSICQGIVEAHGGRIWAENLADGVAFNFTLPLEWEGSRPVLPPSAPEEETEGL